MTNNDILQNCVFRYRGIDALLGEFKELEEQSIYFSPPEDLNDPMEDFRKVFWRGDHIKWRNLLRHYVLCLQNRVQDYLERDNKILLGEEDIVVFELKPERQELAPDCWTVVQKSETFIELLSLLNSAERDISRVELAYHLTLVHSDWLCIIRTIFYQKGMIRIAPRQADKTRIVLDLRHFKDATSKILEQDSDEVLEALYETGVWGQDQTFLKTIFNNEDEVSENRISLLSKFPEQYLRSLMKLVYPPWYVACFSRRYDNAAMWSYYANNHNGCCLVFRPEISDGQSRLLLTGSIGQSPNGIIKEARQLKLEDIRYSNERQGLEFFSNIGRLSRRRLMRNWFQGEDDKTSPLAQHLNENNEGEWHKSYWDKFRSPLLTKLTDWEHEQETRIILTDTLSLHETTKERVFTYDYNQLEGIIFGMKVSMNDKIRILKIFEQKHEKNSGTHAPNFFQAKYNQHTGKIDANHWSLLSFE